MKDTKVLQLEERFLKPGGSPSVNSFFEALEVAVKDEIMESVEMKDFEAKCLIRDAREVALEKARRYAKRKGYTNIIYEEISVIDGASDSNRHCESLFMTVMYK